MALRRVVTAPTLQEKLLCSRDPSEEGSLLQLPVATRAVAPCLALHGLGSKPWHHLWRSCEAAGSRLALTKPASEWNGSQVGLG